MTRRVNFQHCTLRFSCWILFHPNPFLRSLVSNASSVLLSAKGTRRGEKDRELLLSWLLELESSREKSIPLLCPGLPAGALTRWLALCPRFPRVAAEVP